MATNELQAAARRAILEGRGRSRPAARKAAFDGESEPGAPAVVAAYVVKVRDTAYKVTDDDVAALRAAGLDDDHIFELSVATAIGQATRQYDAAVAALDAALAARDGGGGTGAG